MRNFFKLFQRILADEEKIEAPLDESSEIEFRDDLPAIELCLTIEYDKSLS